MSESGDSGDIRSCLFLFSQQHELTTYRPCIIAIIYISPEYSDTWGTNVSSCEELATDKQSTERGHGFYH